MNSEEIELVSVGEIIDEVSKKYDKIWKKRNRDIQLNYDKRVTIEQNFNVMKNVQFAHEKKHN